ncbi:MAG: NUDIX domain-containing protein [Gemmatimonadetes bacterium]|uniref:NUDIX domain-containing protein n=1 Tax=Candidatus Kutchimonas denitrificans TaxID=3056748 RepID=A0AAE4ZBQ1_9BACT|nr:NUDIX domain-containing protein [Gemmatimonadota bacterium]NIR75341.1 NUDIX domain-containing protein [Candidatus Kutchimonas denitrificans]NIS00973.1 NUDIX domain-containing protein [Gemmatimonadota bacterium]NIT66600.1 NUDIX domain-containing protein [Gemmatimonadota bacterium]NIU53170.1 NUDIX domain-containing protein [Gemmatimonadota bacterium]
MPKTSAGLLMYRIREGALEVLLVHPGGPFWRSKDKGAWTIPKGEIGSDEDALAAARREFEEETGLRAKGPFIPLTPVRQKGGKTVRAWAFAGDCDPQRLRSNVFELEWPPGSGQAREFPETDRAGFFGLDETLEKMNPAQVPLVEELAARLKLE